jgi:hypothetical protein
LENTILKLGDKKDALEMANEKLRDKTLDQEALIASSVYLNQHLMKFDAWPKKSHR